MSYGILVTVRGVLPDEESKRLLTGGDGQPMAFPTLEQAEAAAARLASVPGAEFKAVPLPTGKRNGRMADLLAKVSELSTTAPE